MRTYEVQKLDVSLGRGPKKLDVPFINKDLTGEADKRFLTPAGHNAAEIGPTEPRRVPC